MNFFDLANATAGTRILTAFLAFLLLAGLAAGTLVAAMMFVLFSADATNAVDHSDLLLNRVIYFILFSLVFAVVLPPIMLVFKISAAYSAVPAGIGFTCAGLATMWYVLITLGSN